MAHSNAGLVSYYTIQAWDVITLSHFFIDSFNVYEGKFMELTSVIASSVFSNENSKLNEGPSYKTLKKTFAVSNKYDSIIGLLDQFDKR